MFRGAARGTPFSQTATHSTSAVATQTGVAGKKHYLTDLSGSSDKATSQILIKDGNTVIWQDIVGAGSYRINFLMPLAASIGANLSVTVDGTSACCSNMSGFTL